MTIMAVDNLKPRLTQFHNLLGEICPGYEIAVFNDPFFAVQYSLNHGIDIAFVQENLRPINYVNVSDLLHKFNENTKVYLIVDKLDCSAEEINEKENFSGYLENPVGKEKIETLLAKFQTKKEKT